MTTTHEDCIRVFFASFSITQTKGGEFYTPHSNVELIASLIEPFDGTG
jgi:type I restriction enzyme M protein